MEATLLAQFRFRSGQKKGQRHWCRARPAAELSATRYVPRPSCWGASQRDGAQVLPRTMRAAMRLEAWGRQHRCCPHPSRRAYVRCSVWNGFGMRAPRDEDGDRARRRLNSHHCRQPSSFPRRVFLASFRGAGEAREPGIHTHGLWLWIPALAASRLGRNDQLKTFAPNNTPFVPAARFLRPGFASSLHSPLWRGWAERRGTTDR